MSLERFDNSQLFLFCSWKGIFIVYEEKEWREGRSSCSCLWQSGAEACKSSGRTPRNNPRVQKEAFGYFFPLLSVLPACFFTLAVVLPWGRRLALSDTTGPRARNTKQRAGRKRQAKWETAEMARQGNSTWNCGQR